jgi:ethanolamine ammonia-lyase large subunit
MDLEKIMEGLSKELIFSVKAMSKAKDLNEKEIHSRIVKNVSESLGVFFDLAGDMMPFDLDDDSDEDEIPF